MDPISFLNAKLFFCFLHWPSTIQHCVSPYLEHFVYALVEFKISKKQQQFSLNYSRVSFCQWNEKCHPTLWLCWYEWVFLHEIKWQADMPMIQQEWSCYGANKLNSSLTLGSLLRYDNCKNAIISNDENV